MPASGPSSADPTAGSAGYRPGCLFVVSAPSGAGKTTLCNTLRNQLTDLAYSVSYTTRAQRRGEREGHDYHFIGKQAFEQGIADHRWAEWAKVHGHYYGSSALWIDRTLQSGADILMDIDVQGARQIVARFPSAVTIFIMPPSLEELERRLRARSTDDDANIALRLKNAREEIDWKEHYDHVIINDELERAADELIGIIQRHRNARE